MDSGTWDYPHIYMRKDTVEMDLPCPVGVSTAWNASKHVSGRAMLQEYTNLGFDCFELSVHVTQEMIAEIRDLAGTGSFTISSLHNYCPMPSSIDRESASLNHLHLSSPESSIRRAAVSATKNTIDWAAKLGARIVVLHLGVVPIRQDYGMPIMAMATEGRLEEARELLKRDLMERAMERGPYIENLISSLKVLAPYAETAGIKLGCENRYFYTEIPTIDEFMMIFKHVNSRTLGYWHDTGHAHVAEMLGIATQEDFLRKYGDRLIGMHVHDATGHNDHKALGDGEIDFSRFVPFIKPDTQMVVEVHHATPEQLVKSHRLVEKLRDLALTAVEA